MLPTIHRILYASDLKQGSKAAFRAAASLCGHYESHITYLHVIEPQNTGAEKLVRGLMSEDKSLQALHDDSIKHVQEQVLERVKAFCDSELDENETLKDEQVTARVEEGNRWESIIKVAEEINASIIVMGVRHNNKASKLLMGSTSSKVMNHSRRPVLIVPLKDD